MTQKQSTCPKNQSIRKPATQVLPPSPNTLNPQHHDSPNPPAEHTGAPPPAGSQNLTPAVPPPWTTSWDPAASHWTYHNPTTGQTQLEHPDPANYAGQSMPPGGPVLEKDGKPKKDHNGMLIGAAGGLATGVFGKSLGGKGCLGGC